ncbi:MAG: sulfatase-like hydrolase/transferase, partial [Bacteroidales bacterium]|nr:sulfatase-like hydrolase/transferase [Bacteroidales bacterium]
VHWPMEAPHQDVNIFRKYKISPGRQLLMAMLKNLDDGVGEIVKNLKEKGLYENTIIFYLSDNGGAPNMLADNKPLKNYKNSAYEGGHRVPFSVSWPGKIKEGSTNPALVSSLDILPTMLDIAGLELPKDKIIDGKSMIPVLLKGETNLHDELFWHGANQRMAYRKGDWKWGYDRGNEFLYNMKNDIGETKNLLTEEPERVLKMKERFGEWLSEMAEPDQGSTDWPLKGINKK